MNPIRLLLLQGGEERHSSPPGGMTLPFMLLFQRQGTGPQPPVVYCATWAGTSIVVRGATGTLRFKVTRQDGQPVAIPDSMTISVTDYRTGTLIVTLPAQSQSGVPSVQQYLSARYLFDFRGSYMIQLRADFGGNIVGVTFLLVVNDGLIRVTFGPGGVA